MSKLAIIGGSGIYNIEGVNLLQKIPTDTPFGKPSNDILELEVEGNSFYFIPRHGEGHKISPSEINYQANIYALKSLGAEMVISISAVGSLKDQHAPGDFVLVNQFIDWTKGLRKRTFFSDGVVGHVSVAEPVNLELRGRIKNVLENVGVKHSLGGAYLCIEGPQFSTQAESHIYRSFGADVIGMTNVPESFLAKEAGMAYATVAMVTDYDCWKDEHCSVEEIMHVMKDNYISASKMVLKLIPDLIQNPISFQKENKHALMTNPELLSTSQNEIIATLLM
jgi:5'-methylthioadenosine phosphorylase